VRAEARLVAEPDGRGGTRLSTLYGEPPLLPRRTGPRGGEAEVHLVGGAAGPLGGDDLRLSVEVRAGARLCVRTVAASLAQPSEPAAPSHLRVQASVAAGAVLRWLPEPLVAVAGCDHTVTTTVTLAEGAGLTWRDELVGGRHGEDAGDVRLVTTVRHGRRTLLRQDLAIGPHAPGWAGPAVVGGRAAGTLLVVDPAWAAEGPPAARSCGPGAAVLPLATGPAVLVTASGADPGEVRKALGCLTFPLGPMCGEPVRAHTQR
jgi:urease accessory protein